MRSLSLQVESLLSEPAGKPKSTGVGNLSLLQNIFLTQELNQGALPCRRICYQLSYQESSYVALQVNITKMPKPIFKSQYRIKPQETIWQR